MLSNILVVAGLFAVAMTAQAAKDPAKMTVKFQPQKMAVSPQPTPTPTATPTSAAKSINEKGVKRHGSPDAQVTVPTPVSAGKSISEKGVRARDCAPNCNTPKPK